MKGEGGGFIWECEVIIIYELIVACIYFLDGYKEVWFDCRLHINAQTETHTYRHTYIHSLNIEHNLWEVIWEVVPTMTTKLFTPVYNHDN